MNLLIISITAILANAVPIIRDLPPEPNIPPDGDSNLSKDALHRTPNPSEIHQRFYRASDPNLETHVSNLKMVARITNGIYLIQGITSGTIDSDELISEILRFGPVKPSDISAIDISIVQSATDDMKSLPAQLVATAEAEKVEKVFDGLKAVLAEVDGIGNLAEWTHEKEHFKKEIDRLAKDGVDMNDVELLRTALTPWKAVYKKLTEKSPAASADDVTNLKKSLEGVKTIIPKILEPGSIWQFTNFTSVADGISPILKADRGVDAYLKHTQDMKMTDAEGVAYTTYMNSTAVKLNDLMGRMGDVNTVSKLLASRGEVKRQLHHTFGFPKGVSDLSLLSSNLFDSWIVNVIKTKRLEVALGQLKGLAAISKQVDESIGKDAAGIRSLLDTVKSISDIFKNIDSAKSGLSQGYNCTLPFASRFDKTSFTALIKTLQEIDAKLLQIRETKVNLTEYVKTGVLKMCDEVITICEKMTADGSNSPTIVKQLEEYEHLGDFGEYLREIGKSFNAIVSLTDIDHDAKTAKLNMDSLDTYHDKISTEYSDYFKCLQDQDQLKLVSEAIDGLNRIRGWKDDMAYTKTLDGGLEVVKKVAETKSGLDNMKTSIKELSALKTKEIDALKDLPEAAKHSEVIGKSVQGLAGMAEALEQDSDLRKIVDNIGVVESGNQKTKNPSLVELVKLSKDITPMLNSLTTFSTSLSEFSKSDSLAVHADTFSSAKQVSGVTFRVSTGDFSSMVEAVEELKKISPSDSAPLTQVEEGLKKMETLDLDFARFKQSFDNSKNSLTALDLFFAKTWKKFEPTTPISAQRPTLGLETSTGDVVGSGALSAAEKDEEKKEDNDDLKYAGGTLAFLLIILAIVFFLLYKFQRPWLIKILPCLCWKKEKKKKEKVEDEKPPEPPLPPAPPLIGPILPPIGYFLKLFIVPIIRQFEVIQKEHNVEKENLIFCMFEFYEVHYDAARLIAWKTKSALPREDLANCRFNFGRTIVHPVALENYGDRFAQPYLHGNYLMFDGEEKPKDERTKWILIEGPMPSSPEPEDPKKPREKNSTIGKFWWLAKQNKTQSIVALLSPTEIKDYPYFPRKVNETFKEKDCNLTLKCDKLEIEFGGLLETRTITGTFEKEPPFTVTHYAYTGWLTGSPPKLLTPLKKIFRKLATDSTPPIIHCSDGQERTGMFALAGLMKHRLKTRTEKLDIKQCVIDVINVRENALGDISDVLFGGHLCMELLADGQKLSRPLQKDVDKLRSAWDSYNVENAKREPESVIENFDKLCDSEKVQKLKGKLEKKKERKMEEAKKRKEEKK